jgi:hypothetical protein
MKVSFGIESGPYAMEARLHRVRLLMSHMTGAFSMIFSG